MKKPVFRWKYRGDTKGPVWRTAAIALQECLKMTGATDGISIRSLKCDLGRSKTITEKE